MKLTGNFRFRSEKKCFRAENLVLQVEETGIEYDYCGGFVDSYKSIRWRDAKTEDLLDPILKDKF